MVLHPGLATIVTLFINVVSNPAIMWTQKPTSVKGLSYKNFCGPKTPHLSKTYLTNGYCGPQNPHLSQTYLTSTYVDPEIHTWLKTYPNHYQYHTRQKAGGGQTPGVQHTCIQLIGIHVYSWHTYICTPNVRRSIRISAIPWTIFMGCVPCTCKSHSQIYILALEVQWKSAMWSAPYIYISCSLNKHPSMGSSTFTSTFTSQSQILALGFKTISELQGTCAVADRIRSVEHAVDPVKLDIKNFHLYWVFSVMPTPCDLPRFHPPSSSIRQFKTWKKQQAVGLEAWQAHIDPHSDVK